MAHAGWDTELLSGYDTFSGPRTGIRVRAAREERAWRILMVDDGGLIAGTVQSQLENSGWDVLIAKDAQMALHLQRRERPDLMLVNLMSPNVDRTEHARDMAARADLAAMHLIALTTCSDQIAKDGPGGSELDTDVGQGRYKQL